MTDSDCQSVSLPKCLVDFCRYKNGCHPGVVLGFFLNELGLSQRQFAININRPYQAINEIVRGKKQVTAETALQLETALYISAHFWMDLQVTYDILACKKKMYESS